MRFRLLSLFLILFVAAGCAAPEPEPEPEPEAAPMDDAAAVDAVRVAYMDAYNAGDAAGVTALYTDGAWYMPASGSANQGHDAIQAALETQLATGGTVNIEALDTVVMGDYALVRGNYEVAMSPEMGFGGAWFGVQQKVDGEWKINTLMTNYTAPPAEGMPAAAPPERTLADLEDSPLADSIAYYVEHYNMGHADMVAARYGENAVVAYADQPVAEGRAAVQAALEAAMATGSPQLAIHHVGGIDLGDGWYVGGGWYEVTTEDGSRQEGHWLSASTAAEDGSRQIQWTLTNRVHGAM